MKIGVLALQGDVPEHRTAFEAVAGPGSVRLVRTRTDLESIDALALPGGESTTISHLVDEQGLRELLRSRIEEGLPVLATCAGLIFLSRRLDVSEGGANPDPIPALDITVRRNGYGRQRESFEAPVRIDGIRGGPFPGVFLRAPRILAFGPQIEAFARQDREVVGVRSGRIWGLAFHPELSGDGRIHRAFLAATLGRT
ncbi:MAG TPA: pyridoxal 5'-phosphate synthase glutaminase subunit PdxT [Thermoplasmata archaeon]|nr:pyridoxal 5'-phosphate synthase glutaminase subunit PdxT [Thermoplasmata archaeon]